MSKKLDMWVKMLIENKVISNKSDLTKLIKDKKEELNNNK